MLPIYSKARIVLFIASVGNFLGTLVALISPAFFNSQIFKFPPDQSTTFPYLALYHYCFWGVGLIMAVAYWMAAINPEKHRIVLLIGSLGKLLLVAFLLMLYFQEQGRWPMIAISLLDGPLGILMMWMYLKTSKSEA